MRPNRLLTVYERSTSHDEASHEIRVFDKNEKPKQITQ